MLSAAPGSLVYCTPYCKSFVLDSTAEDLGTPGSNDLVRYVSYGVAELR